MKKIFLVLFLLLISLFSFRFLLDNGFPYTHDGENHLARFANYKIALKEGQIPPRFAPNLMNHYGYPVFNYNYPLANIISLPFSFFKLSYTTTFKIMIFSFVVIGMIGSFKYLSALGFSKKASIYSSLVFITFPYLVSNILFRGNIGEIMAPSLFIWLLWFVEILKKEGSRGVEIEKKMIFSIIVFSFFLLSHNIAVLIGVPLLFIYAFFRIKNKQGYLSFLFTFLTSVLLTLWFWLPAYLEKGLVVVGSSSNQFEFVNHFVNLKQLLFSALEFGFSYQGMIDSISFSIGLPLIISVLLFLSFLINALLSSGKKLKIPKVVLLTSIIVLLLMIFQFKFTESIWKIIPFANFIQFPWRLSLFLMVFSLPLIAYVFELLSNNLKIFMIALLVLIIFKNSNLKPVDRIYKTNIDFDAFSQSTSTQNENLPINFTYLEIGNWQPGPSILDGLGSIEVDRWNGSNRSYKLDLKKYSIITEPTMYFEGWQTLISGEKIDYIDSDEIKGRIAYKLEPGVYYVQTKFTQNTWPRLIGNFTSLGALLGLASIYFIKILKTKKINENTKKK